jgi:hypothetical protein
MKVIYRIRNTATEATYRSRRNRAFVLTVRTLSQSA